MPMMKRSYKYQQGGSTGNPTPPSWMANDPKFANVTFEGDAVEMSKNRSFLDFDFSYTLDGAKIYGMDGGNSLFIVDRKGNVFQADSSTNNQGDLLDHIESIGAKVDEGFDLRAHGPKGSPEGTQSKTTQDLLRNLGKQE